MRRGWQSCSAKARRFFCYLFLSHSALILVGLEICTPISLTGALCLWLSVGIALGGFGFILRALESRRGLLRLQDFQGLYEQTPKLAICFFLTGLASVGFPGTIGFIGTEMLVDGAVVSYPYVGILVVLAAASTASPSSKRISRYSQEHNYILLSGYPVVIENGLRPLVHLCIISAAASCRKPACITATIQATELLHERDKVLADNQEKLEQLSLKAAREMQEH